MREISKTFDTGDINFTAAAMSMGFPLNDAKPCSLILRDNGKNYVRFHLYAMSMDGGITIEMINKWWGNPETCTNTAYSSIMNLIKAGVRAGSISTSEDWLSFTIDYLKSLGIFRHPKNMQDIPSFIERCGEKATESTLVSFCYNREYAFDVMSKCKRSIMITHGRTSHARIDEHLPLWQRKELIARVKN